MAVLLCSLESININNNIINIGTPLHVACRKNNFKLVSTLLNFQADCTIRDNNGFLAVRLSSDNLIRKRIFKTLENFKQKQHELEENLINQYTFVNNDKFVPMKPSKVVGSIHKMGRFLLNYYKRYLEIDPVFGSLRRFERKSLYPYQPLYFCTL